MAARIFDWLSDYAEHDSESRPSCTQRTLARALHAGRYPKEFVSALEFLAKQDAITVQGGVVNLIDASANERLRLPDPYDPIGRKLAREQKQERRKKRGKRPPTKWFLNLMRDRGELSPSAGHEEFRDTRQQLF
jgi:hypothetical protein